MCTMPRPKGKAKKIAFSILGTPQAIAAKKTALQRKIDHRLLYDNTQRVR